ncbi:golgi associated plant pathogenesis-related prote in; golgi associated plant pathogeneis-related protein [Trichuris trichiura]|uniref:Golgi associated plant pathogenesis-related prote in golgi associated plant pathogeneis-related protein n=1 Tax=Trichuris trichiura TaxID=36087 RepID=A0A077Z7E2_TRITR|nr:golgi associated plant pathogenesis-related prote in; golgi associated plant pathogeneis-related protein [Trichuris trichiura]
MDDQNSKLERLSEVSEQLDEHLMNKTLKELKHRPGTKFTLISESYDIAFQRDFLDAHNRIRAQYGSPLLSWCQQLADEAESWAADLLNRGRIIYKDQQGLGENIAIMKIESPRLLPTGEQISRLWAQEANLYDFDNPSWTEECQNFTQLVWKATREVGCSRQWSPSQKRAVVVAFYRPAGNGNNTQSFKENIPQRRYAGETECSNHVENMHSSIR